MGNRKTSKRNKPHQAASAVIERDQAAEEENMHVRDLAFLSRTAMELVELSPEEDIYQFIGQRLQELCGDSAILVNSFDEASATFCVREAVGFGDRLGKVNKLLGTQLVGMPAPINGEARIGLKSGKLAHVQGGLYMLASGGVPEGICEEMEEVLGLGNVYAIGFAWNGGLFGSAAILAPEGTKLRNPAVIETFVWQSSVALQRRQTQEALRASEEYFRSLTENALDIVMTTDGCANLCYASPSVERVLGYDPKELTGRNAFEFIHPDDIMDVDSNFTGVLQNQGAGAYMELRARHADGSWRFIEAIGNNLLHVPAVRGIVVNFRDVTDRKQIEKALQKAHEELEMRVQQRTTELRRANKALHLEIKERKQAEDALRRGEQYFRSLIENSLDAIVVVNDDGTFRYVSPSFERVLGYDPEERIGRNSFDIVHPDDVPRATGIFAQLSKRQGPTVHTEVRCRHKDGSWRTLEAIANNLLHDSVVEGIVVNLRDVTERRQAEEEKQNMEQQVQLAGRLAAVGELAAGVAHELNNPLAAVQGFAQFLASRADLEESIREDVETIYREAQRATRITANLLSFARRHKPEKSLVSINEVIEKSLELHAYRMRVNNIELAVQLDSNLPDTMADFYQMQQVFVNIITNAEQAMTEARGKGKLTVRTRKAGDMIRATFTDDGPGIPKDNLSRIFEPFFTTKDTGKGTGLGLSICYGIVQEHGGRLHAASRSNEGTTFVMELPIVCGDQPETEQTNPIGLQTA